MKATLIFPNQLFHHHPGLSKDRKVFLMEEPVFFYDRANRILFHKKKILLHRLSMQQYQISLEKRGYQVDCIKREFLEDSSDLGKFFKKNQISSIDLCHTSDARLEKGITLNAKKHNISINWHDSPSFLLSNKVIQEDFPEGKKYSMAQFYKNQRHRFNLLLDKSGNPTGGKWSFDEANRKKLPKKIVIPSINIYTYPEKLFSSQKIYVEKNYPKNPGSIDDFQYPTTREQALNALDNFLEKRFTLFGDYEDAISSREPFLFHSLLTPSLNIGLITPSEVIQKTMDFCDAHPIPINSLEGFIRQIIGWREFIRGVYQVAGDKQKKSNYWNFKKQIPESFYTGETGIPPVDNVIKRILKSAYCHHIERLMVLGNIMFLLEFDPNAVYRWFMELFIDAYEWVMVPNIYGMSQFSDGGLMCTKPYISGSNYILKMSDYTKGEWTKTWDALYWQFIDKQRAFFLKNHRMRMMVSMYDKKSDEIKKSYLHQIQYLSL